MRLMVTGHYKATALMDELLDAFPHWRGTPAPPERKRPAGTLVDPLLRVEFTADTVWLEFPDDAEIGVVRAILAAHDPTKEDKGERWVRERREAIARLKADPAMADLVTALGL